MLKLLIVLCFVVGSTLADDEYPPKELLEMLKPIREYCSKELGLTNDEIDNYDIYTQTERRFKCYMSCFLKQSNWMTMEGEIKYDFIISNPWKPIADIVIRNVKHCRDLPQRDDDCDMTYDFAKCVADYDFEHWFLP